MDGEPEQASVETDNTTKLPEKAEQEKTEDDVITAPNPPSAEMVKGTF